MGSLQQQQHHVSGGYNSHQVVAVPETPPTGGHDQQIHEHKVQVLLFLFSASSYIFFFLTLFVFSFRSLDGEIFCRMLARVSWSHWHILIPEIVRLCASIMHAWYIIVFVWEYRYVLLDNNIDAYYMMPLQWKLICRLGQTMDMKYLNWNLLLLLFLSVTLFSTNIWLFEILSYYGWFLSD